MKKLLASLLLAAAPLFAQTALTKTSLSAAVNGSLPNASTVGSVQTQIPLSSVSGISAIAAPQTITTVLFVDREEMAVQSVNSSIGTVTVLRGYNGTLQSPHASGATVFVGSPDQFYLFDPAGACTPGTTKVTPWINVTNGNQWTCPNTLNSTWLLSGGPYFTNPGVPNTLTAAGLSPCARAVATMLAFPGRTITAQNDVTGAVQNCGSDQLDNANGNNAWIPTTLLLPGGMVWTTDLGVNFGDRENIIGDNQGNITTTVGTTSGTNIIASSVFPTGVNGGTGITVSGGGQSGSSLVVAYAGGTSLNGVPITAIPIEPGTHFKIAGDTTDYVVTQCGHNNSSCMASQGTAQASNYYNLTSTGTTTLKLTPTSPALSGLQATPANGAAVTLAAPVLTFGDWNTQKNGSGSSQQQLIRKLASGTINGWGTCFMLGIEPQEDSTLDNVGCGNANHAYVFYGTIHSGPHKNLRASWASVACGAPFSGFLSAAEIAASQLEIDGFAAFASAANCTPAAFPFGLFHITNNPLSALGNGTMWLNNFHGELNGTSGTGDVFFDDATTGNRIITNAQGCSAATCKNLYHWASTARGTLDLEMSVACVATTNFIQDDLNGNTIPCGAYTTGTGFYKIYQDGTVETNLCAGLVKGICRSPSGNSTQKAETGTADTNVLTLTPPTQAGSYHVHFAVSVSSATAGVIEGTLTYKDSNGNTQTAIPIPLTQTATSGGASASVTPAQSFTTSVASNYTGDAQIDTDNSATAIVVKWVGGGTTAAKVTASIERTN